MGFLDFLKDVSKGLTTAAGNLVPIVGPAAASQLNRMYRKGGVVAMANGGMLRDDIRGLVQQGRMVGEKLLPEVRDYLGLQNGGVISTPMGRGMVAPAGMKKPRKKRVQKKKK